METAGFKVRLTGGFKGIWFQLGVFREKGFTGRTSFVWGPYFGGGKPWWGFPRRGIGRFLGIFAEKSSSRGKVFRGGTHFLGVLNPHVEFVGAQQGGKKTGEFFPVG